MVGEDRSDETVILATRKWIEKAVIGLNLCPFASAVYSKNLVRYFVSKAGSTQELSTDLISEMRNLNSNDASSANFDTTLIIHPFVLLDFLEYCEYLKTADSLLKAHQLAGILQIASFHPLYEFSSDVSGSITHYTNRSPYPVIHLLKERSVSEAISKYPEADQIPEKNVRTLLRLGLAGWKKLMA